MFLFPLCLNQLFDDVCGRILGTKLLPGIRTAFFEVRHEESSRELILGSIGSSPSVDGSTLASHRPSFHNSVGPAATIFLPLCCPSLWNNWRC